MNPNYVDPYHDQGGDANGLVGMVVWFFLLSAVFWLTGALRLSYKTSLWCWGVCNIAPLVWVLTLNPDFAPFLGICVVALFSWSMGRSVFDGRERERVLKERFIAEEAESVNGNG